MVLPGAKKIPASAGMSSVKRREHETHEKDWIPASAGKLRYDDVDTGVSPVQGQAGASVTTTGYRPPPVSFAMTM